jgi:hypothetical protein
MPEFPFLRAAEPSPRPPRRRSRRTGCAASCSTGFFGPAHAGSSGRVDALLLGIPAWLLWFTIPFQEDSPMRLLSLFLSVKKNTSRRTHPAGNGRLGVEALEDRTLPANLSVLPIVQPADGATTFHNLQDALAAASTGSTITIEPGVIADFNTDVTVGQLTIQGDPNVPSSILPAYNLSVDASGLNLKNMNLNFVSVNAGFNNTTLYKCTVSSVFIQGGPTNNGNNVITQCQISSTITITGNTNLGVATNDQVTNNNFTGFGSPMLSVSSDSGAVVKGNLFSGGGDITTDTSGNNVTGAPQTAIAINGGVNVTVANNTITLPGKAQPAGVTGTFTGIAVSPFDPTTAGLPKGTPTAPPVVSVLNNAISTVTGTGVAIKAMATATGDRDTQVLVQGNDFHGNAIGVSYTGNNGTSITSDLGGGILGSLGGNNFRGFTARGTVNAAAIVLTNVAAAARLAARDNLFVGDGATAPTVVFAGGATVDVSAPLTVNQSFVQVLFNNFLGRSGSISELNTWVNTLTSQGQAAVVKGIFESTASLDNIVAGFYLKYLGRAADAGGEAYWVSLIQSGSTLESIQAGFISSAEFISSNNSDYVQGLYRTFFNRTGNVAELAYWYTQLQQPSGLNLVSNGFAVSTENRSSFVQSIYTQFFHRPGSKAEVSSLAAQTGDLLSIEAQMLNSSEFFNKG